MSLGYYVDVHVREAVTAGLRRRGVDVLTSQEDGTRTDDDELLLARATDLGRVFYTDDEDFIGIAAEWTRTGRRFAGLVYAHQLNITIGQAVRDLELIAKALDPEDMENRIAFVPL